MQPYIFPYIGYYQLIQAVDKFIIYDDVNFINRGWVNRNNILVNNQAYLFSVPLKDASQNKLINEIMLVDDEGWKKKLSKTLEHSYKKAPHFDNIFSLITSIFFSNLRSIKELATESIAQIAKYLDLETEFVNSSSHYNNSALKGQDRIIDICLQEKADHYINPIGGMEIYTRSLFDQVNIKLNFIKPEPNAYRQFKDEFVPNLSIIDVLMFNSKQEVKAMLFKYELISQ